MANYSDVVSRGNVPVPEPMAQAIIEAAANQSVIMQNAKAQMMSSKTLTQPVISEIPNAYWVNGDTGLKQTTNVKFEMPKLVAEELATLLPVPDALFDDTDIPLWDAVKPYIAEAFGKKLDAAGLFGVDAPASWGTGLVPQAITAGNTVTSTGDLTVGAAKLGELIANSGYSLNGFVSAPGFNWKLVGLRDSTGAPVYTPPTESLSQGSLYGYGVSESRNGAWQTTTPATHLIGVDWSKILYGIRQDMSVSILDQMVISDENGKVIFNAAQQDAKVLRVVMRVGFLIVNPANNIQTNPAKRCPAAVLTA